MRVCVRVCVSARANACAYACTCDVCENGDNNIFKLIFQLFSGLCWSTFAVASTAGYAVKCLFSARFYFFPQRINV